MNPRSPTCQGPKSQTTRSPPLSPSPGLMELCVSADAPHSLEKPLIEFNFPVQMLVCEPEQIKLLFYGKKICAAHFFALILDFGSHTVYNLRKPTKNVKQLF